MDTTTHPRRFAQWTKVQAGMYRADRDGIRWTAYRDGRTWRVDRHRTVTIGGTPLGDGETTSVLTVITGDPERVEFGDTLAQGQDSVELAEALMANDWAAASYWGDVIGGMVPRP